MTTGELNPPRTTAGPLATAAEPAPFRRFHLRVTATTFGANFSDGYALGMIGAVLGTLTTDLALSGVWQGLLGASALIGLFAGSVLMGRLADRFGRQKLYLFNFVLITLASAAQLWADDPAWLFALRLLIGFGLGADYAVGPTILSEFAPRRHRGVLLGSLTVMWTVGYVAANIVGTLLAGSHTSPYVLLATGALPAALVLVLRIGTPESPGWLASQGRVDEARAIARDYLGTELPADAGETKQRPPRFAELFAPAHRRNTWFGFVFYSAQVLPYFAIYTFTGTILHALDVGDEDVQYVVLNLLLLAGGVGGLWFMQRVGRRPLTIWTFGIMAVSLAALGVLGGAGAAAMMVPFFVYTFVMAGASNLTQVYPAELYPTHLRGTGVGFLNGTSRIASAIGTFVLPVSLSSLGLAPSMFWLTGVLVAGLVASLLWAPETRHTVTNDGS